MTKSTQVITDLKTVIANGPSTVSQANANAPAGVIMDLNGNVELCVVACYDIQRKLTELLKDYDSGTDGTNIGLLQGVANVLV